MHKERRRELGVPSFLQVMSPGCDGTSEPNLTCNVAYQFIAVNHPFFVEGSRRCVNIQTLRRLTSIRCYIRRLTINRSVLLFGALWSRDLGRFPEIEKQPPLRADRCPHQSLHQRFFFPENENCICNRFPEGFAPKDIPPKAGRLAGGAFASVGLAACAAFICASCAWALAI